MLFWLLRSLFLFSSLFGSFVYSLFCFTLFYFFVLSVFVFLVSCALKAAFLFFFLNTNLFL